MLSVIIVRSQHCTFVNVCRLQAEEQRRHRFEASAGCSLEEALQQLITSSGGSGFLGARLKGNKGGGEVSQTRPIPSVEDKGAPFSWHGSRFHL